MKFKIPFTFAGIEVLKRKSKSYLRFASQKKSDLDDYLNSANAGVSGREYISICYQSFVINLLAFAVTLTSIFGLFKLSLFYLYGVGAAILISAFILFNQRNYPKIFSMNKQMEIEKNLLPVLQDMMVQLNSGVPVFRILSNIADSNYGEVTEEFKKIIKEINSGVSQIEAIEKYAKLNTSPYFRRILWQISNGMRAGSDMTIVISESIKNLAEEQTIQVQSYGSKLNPLIMFYMLVAIILPSLGITFLIIISSLLGIGEQIIQLIFFLIFVFVVFMQIMFIGIIKSRRPSLL